MKKQFLLVASGLLLAFGAQAQTSAGRWLVTGGINLSSASTADALDRRTENQGISISPAIGYLVVDHLAVGLTGGVGGSRREDLTPATVGAPAITQVTRAGSCRIALFGRYYWHLGEKTALTATLSGGIGRSRYEVTYETQPEYLSEVTQHSRSLSATLTPAFVYFPLPRLGLEVSLGSFYASRDKNDNDVTGPASQSYESTTRSAGANFSLNSFSIGGSYFFGGGQ